MTDIYGGITIIATVAVMLAVLGERLGRRWPRRRIIIAVAGVVAFMLLFATVLLDSVWMLWLLPVSSAIVVANWQLPAAGLVVGLAWHVLPRPIWRKCLLLVPLAALAVWRFYGPLAGSPPENIENRWIGDVCVQSSFSSCGAAAAATLLHAAGIDASEAEMAELCLTRPAGTSLHGLYRGLKLKTAGTQWRVDIVMTRDGLRASESPVLLNVWLPRRGADLDPRHERDWGWTPGRSHSVVLLGFRPDAKIDVADPNVGREQWFEAALDVLWHGQGLRLVKR